MENYGRAYLLILFFVVLCMTACSEKSGSDQAGNQKKVPVNTQKVMRGKVTSYLEVTGTTAPLNSAKLGSKVEGTITEILVDEGDTIKKGQILLRLDPKDFLLDINRAKAALLTAEAEREKAEHDLEQKQKDWNRLSALYERRVIAKHQYDSMKAAFSMAQAAVEGCKAQISQKKAELDLAEKRYQDSIVRAPFDGVITKKLLNRGEISSLWAYNWETLEVMDLSKIKIECDVSEKWKSQVREGMEAIIEVDAYPNEKFDGKIDTINPKVDPLQKNFVVKIILPNPAYRLTAGMFARVKIVLDVRKEVLTIPEKEILERPDGHFIFVVQDGISKQRKIFLGVRDGGNVEVTEGLKEGEMIVVEGSHRLQDGYQVEMLR